MFFFNQNHRYTPLIKLDFLDFEKLTSLYSRKASFVFNTSLNIISGLILTKIGKKEGNRKEIFLRYQVAGLLLLKIKISASPQHQTSEWCRGSPSYRPGSEYN